MVKTKDILILILLVIAAVYVLNDVAIVASPTTQLHGQRLPAVVLSGYNGTDVSLADLHGSPAVLTFWFPQCGYCRQELPALELLWKKHADDGLKVFAIETSGQKAAAQRFIEAENLTYTFLDGSYLSVDELFNVTMYPTTFIIDDTGIIHSSYVGYNSDIAAEIHAEIEHLISGTPHSH